jgi:hypothetical protein
VERAEALFRRAIALKPQGKYHYMYALVLAKSGKIGDALRQMETALGRYADQLTPSQAATARQAVRVWRDNI